MERAIQLSKNGLGFTYPNPMMGCVIEKNGKIISEDWLYKKGTGHAEEKAINNVKNKDFFLGSTIYITLEPCFYNGKKQSCVDLIINNLISRVVIGTKNPKYKGISIKKLRENGIEVIEDFLKKNIYILNKRFFTFYKKRRPYIILQWSQSYNGLLKMNNINHCNIYYKQIVHKWISEENGILTGKINCNKKFFYTKWFGRNPIRIFIDKELKGDNSCLLLDDYIKNIVFTEKNRKNEKNTEYIRINFNKKTIKNILIHLYNRNIQSIIVEGNISILYSVIRKSIWDECRILIHDTFFKNGLIIPKINGKIFKEINFNKNKIIFVSSLGKNF